MAHSVDLEREANEQGLVADLEVEDWYPVVAFVKVPLVLATQGVMLASLGIHANPLSAVCVLTHVRDDHDLLVHDRRRLMNGRASSVVIVKCRLLLLVGKWVYWLRLRLLNSERWRPDPLGPHVILPLIFHVVLEIAWRWNKVGAAWEMLQLLRL